MSAAKLSIDRVGKRFDAWFLMANAERLVSLERQADCGELDQIAWVDFDEAADLPLPSVTRLMIKEAAARIHEPSRPRPFFRPTERTLGRSYL